MTHAIGLHVAAALSGTPVFCIAATRTLQRNGIECRLGALTILCATIAAAWLAGRAESAAAAVTLAACAACAVIDFRTGYVPNCITLPAFAAAIALQTSAGSPGAAIAGTLACGGTLFALFAVTRGRGIGLGDVKLGCCIGAGFGAGHALGVLEFAFVAGGIVAAGALMLQALRRGDRLRFAPYLFAGAAYSALAFR